MDRMIFPVLLTDVRSEYHFGLSLAGLQSTMFALGMGLTGIPLGYALQRIRRKRIIIAGTLLFSAATALTVVSIAFADMLLWRVLSGVGEAMQLGAILTVASTAFPRRRGLAIGAINMAFALGAVIGPLAGVPLMNHYGTWRAPMLAFAVIGIALAAVVTCAVSPRLTEATPVGDDRGDAAHHRGGATSLRARNPLTLAVMTTLFGLIDFAYIGMYATFLREYLGFTANDAGFAVSLSGLAAFASPLGGWLIDRFDPPHVLTLLSLAQAVAGLALFVGPADLAWQSAWSFIFGLIASSGLYVALAATIVKSMNENHASRASGLFITSIYVAAAFAGLLYSRLVHLSSWTAAGLIQVTGLSLASAVLALSLRRAQLSTVVVPR
jgi:predicted MFS family arabinose efflux permease